MGLPHICDRREGKLLVKCILDFMLHQMPQTKMLADLDLTSGAKHVDAHRTPLAPKNTKGYS